jgi:hypothetical protein
MTSITLIVDLPEDLLEQASVGKPPHLWGTRLNSALATLWPRYTSSRVGNARRRGLKLNRNAAA